jgi:signal transduction histidine kinase
LEAGGEARARRARDPRALAPWIPLLRHLAFVGATATAYAMRGSLHAGPAVLWTLGLAALGNVVTSRLAESPVRGSRFRVIAAAIGIGGWAVLVGLTGGTTSPLVAGFWLEIAFSALIFPPAGTLAVTAAAALTLGSTQLALDASTSAQGRLALQVGLIAVLGALTFAASRHRWREREALAAEAARLSAQLQGVEHDLRSAHVLGQVGERAARWTHRIKGSVHSLRGFAQLLEGADDGPDVHARALAGLRLTIEQLEANARGVLAEAAEPGPRGSGPEGADIAAVLREVGGALARDFPDTRWAASIPEHLPRAALDAEAMQEVLLILTRNAAEAAGGRGAIAVRAELEGGAVLLAVDDEGPGLDPACIEALFSPGTTTKPRGSGFGLFLARRIVRARGGDLIAGARAGPGARFCLRLPLAPGSGAG